MAQAYVSLSLNGDVVRPVKSTVGCPVIASPGDAVADEGGGVDGDGEGGGGGGEPTAAPTPSPTPSPTPAPTEAGATASCYLIYSVSSMSVTAVAPPAGPRYGGTRVTVYGAGFVDYGGLRCAFGGGDQVDAVVVGGRLHCTTPPNGEQTRMQLMLR